MTLAVGLRDVVVSLVLALALLAAVPVILLAGAALAGFFEIGVRDGQGGVARGLATGELAGALLGAMSVAVVAVLWLRRLWRARTTGGG